jgi:putative nucleotidyltransferase with HDIG domain
VCLLTIIALYFIIPGGGRFSYEFQKNAPWRHETLIAPFDFAILKPEEKLKAEKDSVERSYIPYLNIAPAVGEQQTANLLRHLSGIGIPPEQASRIGTALTHIYACGIMNQSPTANPHLKGKHEVFIVNNKDAQRRPLVTLFSLKTAFQAFQDSVYKINASLSQQIDITSFFVENLTYNQDFNAQQLNLLLNTVSISEGMVQAGERVIFSGDLITPEKYRVLDSLKRYFESKSGQYLDRFLLAIGKLLLIIACIALMILYMAFFRPEIFHHRAHLTFILFIITLMVACARFISAQNFLFLYVFPIAILPILLRIFFDSRTAIFGLMVTCLLVGYFAPNSYEFIFLNLTAGITSVFTLYNFHRRSHLIYTSLWIFLTYSLLYMAYAMIHEGNLESIRWINLLLFMGNAGLLLLTYLLLYIFEKLFGFVSDVTLLELSNTNLPLLRKLAEEAPGTFQHSFQVANLAEAVIQQIGGNPFLVYAGALYHDIGKLYNPAYFVENQVSNINPHGRISYIESAKIIIGHVEHGLRLARHYKLPAVLSDFIATHHGTTQVKYFFTLYKNQHPGENISPAEFTYPGPVPSNRETAVVMIVDGIEAASRALSDKTPQTLKELVNRMVQMKLDEGQLDNANLTLRDISSIREILLEKLLNIYHARIEYPKESGTTPLPHPA